MTSYKLLLLLLLSPAAKSFDGARRGKSHALQHPSGAVLTGRLCDCVGTKGLFPLRLRCALRAIVRAS